MNSVRYCLLAAAVFCLFGCSRPDPEPEFVADDPVLARVGSEVITLAQLELAIADSLGSLAALQLGAEGRQKVLESLVIRKMFSQQQAALLDDTAAAELAMRLDAYREELLTRQYLQQQVIPEPVTDAMVQDYYQSYPQEFGGRQYASYRLVRIDVGHNNPALQQQAMVYLAELTETSDWAAVVARANQAGLPFLLLSGSSDEQGLLAEYQRLLQSLEPRQVSAVADVDGRLVRLQVLERFSIAPRPLDSELRQEIRRKLAPLQLKQSIHRASEQLRTQMDVEIYLVP